MGRTHLSRCIDFGHFRFSHNIMRISQISQISEQIGETATTSQDNISSWLFDFPNFCLFAFPSERWRAGGRKRGLRLPNPKKQMTLSALCRIVFVAHMCRQKEKKLPCDVPHLGIGQLCFGLNISKYELQLFSLSLSELCLVVKLMPEMKGNCYFPN